MENKLKDGTFVTYKIDGKQYAGYIIGVGDNGEYKVRALYNHDMLLTAYGDIDYVTEVTAMPKVVAYTNGKDDIEKAYSVQQDEVEQAVPKLNEPVEIDYRAGNYVVHKDILCIVTLVKDKHYLKLMIISEPVHGTARMGMYIDYLVDVDDVKLVKLYKLDNERDVKVGDVAFIGDYAYYVVKTYDDTDKIKVRAIHRIDGDGDAFDIRRPECSAMLGDIKAAYKLSYFMTKEEIAIQDPTSDAYVLHKRKGAKAMTVLDMLKDGKKLAKAEPHHIAKGDIVSIYMNKGEYIYAIVLNSPNYGEKGYLYSEKGNVGLNLNVFAGSKDGVCSPRGYTVSKTYQLKDVTFIASIPYFMDKLMQHTPEVMSDTPSDKLVVLPYPIGHKVYYKSDSGTIYPGTVERYTISDKEFNMVVKKPAYKDEYFSLIQEVWEQKNRLSYNINDLA